jgi:hypothetical protein
MIYKLEYWELKINCTIYIEYKAILQNWR